MTSKLLFQLTLALAVAVFAASSFSLTDDFPCPDIAGYNITDLTKPKYWKFEKDGACVDDPTHAAPCTFFFTFCHSLEEAQECVNSSVCQLNSVSGGLSSIGGYVFDPFVPEEANGFWAFFGSRQIVNPYTNKTCASTLMMKFECDKTAPWPSDGDVGQAPTPTLYNGLTADNCDILIKFDYSGACFGIIPPSSSSTASTSSSPSTSAVSTVSTSIPNPTPSKICVPPAGYDISILTKPQYWVFNINEGCSVEDGSPDKCSILVAFCKPIAQDIPSCEGGSSCVRYPNQPQYSFIAGNFTQDPFTAFDVDGFQADYPPGVLVDNKYSKTKCYAELSVIFVCDPEAIWPTPEPNQPGVAPNPLSFVSVSNTSCHMNITVLYSGACKENPRKPGQMSVGTVLIILFISFAGAYLLFGILINKFVHNESGLRLIPQYESVWLVLWGHITYGFGRVFCAVSGKSVYESV